MEKTSVVLARNSSCSNTTDKKFNFVAKDSSRHKAQAHPFYGDTVPHFEMSTLVAGTSNYFVPKSVCVATNGQNDRILPEKGFR